MKRYICIHGHFYQPPRENPWLQKIERQDSAYPFHDWNEKITAECYAPNAQARILDSEGKIRDIVNNYSKISFNFGPTLLSWLKEKSPEVYQSIIEADKESQRTHSGHGAAIAQAFNHLIMPLSNSRDKQTQVIWGARDFELHFQRKPSGMWLPETAVDLETLDLLAKQGIKFTILSPHQARRIRKENEKNWMDVEEGKLNTKKPYFCELPSGRRIVIFFFNKEISGEVAFGNLLNDGGLFVRRLIDAFQEEKEEPEIVNIATDGESYGHHHRFGEMALAYCLHEIESKELAYFTFYSEYLEMFPPEFEVEISPLTSWSCAHGVERWRADCGCRVDNQKGYSQQWRRPLREAMDWLRERLIQIYESRLKGVFLDPWKARDDYIEVIHNRSKRNIESFLKKNVIYDLSPEQKTEVLKLLEMERNAMLMYTSCGWFFDEITRIETIQVMQYAARAMQLAREVAGIDLEDSYLAILEKAKSSLPQLEDGAKVYQQFVKPAMVDLFRAGAHFALLSLVEDFWESTEVGIYFIENDACDLTQRGGQKLALGKARIHSRIDLEKEEIAFAALYLDDPNLLAGVKSKVDEGSFSLVQSQLKEYFMRDNIEGLISLMHRNFGEKLFTLSDLGRDEKHKVISRILEPKLREVKDFFRKIFEKNYPLLHLLRESKIPWPKVFTTILEFNLNDEFQRLMEEDGLDIERVKKLIQEFNKFSLKPEGRKLSFFVRDKINSLLKELEKNPEEIKLLQDVTHFLSLLEGFLIDLNLWEAQNHYFRVCKRLGEMKNKKAMNGDQEARQWIELMKKLGACLRIRCL